jgi:hypothetical protein
MPETMSAVSRYVVARFPEHELAIERLFRRSESFHSMCEDYADGVDALAAWEDAADPRAEAEMIELRDCLTDLEAEILTTLEEDAAARSG